MSMPTHDDLKFARRLREAKPFCESRDKQIAELEAGAEQAEVIARANAIEYQALLDRVKELEAELRLIRTRADVGLKEDGVAE